MKGRAIWAAQIPAASLFIFCILNVNLCSGQVAHHNGKAIGIPLSSAIGNLGSSSPGSGPIGIALPPPGHNGGGAGNPSNSFRQSVGIPLSSVNGNGVPLSATSANGNLFTVFGVDGPVLPTSIGRGIQETFNHKGSGKGSHSTFLINELPNSVELDKKLSPVPPYFVFPDSDNNEGSLTIGGPKTGGLVPITNPTEDPKLLRLLSQPLVRQRFVAEARADKALKITAILMAHRQVVGGQITYASVRAAETNCPASRINSLKGCSIDGREDSYICEIAFWERAWLNATKVLDEKTACRETENDSDFDNDDHRIGGRLRAVVEGKDIARGDWRPNPTLPDGLTQQQLAVEAFNYVESHSDSDFRGYLAGHSVHSVLVDRARNLTKVQLLVDYGFTVCLKLDWTKGGQKDPRTCPVDNTRSRYSCSLSLLYHPSQLMPFRVVHGGDDKDELKCIKKPLIAPKGATSGNTNLLFASTTSTGITGKDCAGCPSQAALSDPAIQSILKFAIEEYDRIYSDDRNIHKPVALLKAYTQATAGTKYVLTAEVAKTVCLKNAGVVNREQCAQDPTEETEICMFIILHQPWLPSSHLLSANCLDRDEGHRLLSIPAASIPHLGAASTGQHSNVGVPLPSLSSLKPVPLSFNGRSKSGSGVPNQQLDAQTTKIVQFIVNEVNRRDLADDDFDSRGRDDSREFGGFDSRGRDDSREFGGFDSRGRDDSREFSGVDVDGLYKLVKVHKVLPINNNRERRFIVELGETNCSKSFLPRATSAHCTLDPFEEHEVCDAMVGTVNGGLRLLAISCEDLGDYLEDTSLVPPVPSVTWEQTPFLPVGHLAGSNRLTTKTGFSNSFNGQYANMVPASTSSPAVKTAAELVVARYNLLSGEEELMKLGGVLTAHTMTNRQGHLEYLLEVEIAETLCKKYLPIIDQSKCPIDPTEEKTVCQAEVIQGNHVNTQQQSTWDGLMVNKLYCREREDYIVARNTGQEGPWTNMVSTDPKLQELAQFTANQYDLRSDDDDLFIHHKIVSAKYQNTSGKLYDIVVELAETICPKYKEHINKKRCRIDPSEEIKLCNARLFEAPSGVGGVTLTKLQCKNKHSTRHSSPIGGGRHHSHEDDSNEVLILHNVHPSSHARPKFLNKFRKPVYKIHRDHSVESAESNEQFYNNPRAPGSRRHGVSGGRRFDSRSEEDDSDEFLPRRARSQLRGKRRRREILRLTQLLTA